MMAITNILTLAGLRPLHYATYQKYTDAVNLLLVRGSDVDAMDDVGYTALHLCAERGYSDLMSTLLDRGARVKFTELRPDDKVIKMSLRYQHISATFLK